jgi:DNA-directed RNA polymerase specialized sigma subunit
MCQARVDYAVEMTVYNVKARHWKHGWELHIPGVGVTQSRTLAEAETMVRDYIETLTGQDTSGAEVVITAEVVLGLDEEAQAAREAVATADRATRAAAARSRKVARDLKQAGLSGRDIAAILKISAQRVSQLLKSS